MHFFPSFCPVFHRSNPSLSRRRDSPARPRSRKRAVRLVLYLRGIYPDPGRDGLSSHDGMPLRFERGPADWKTPSIMHVGCWPTRTNGGRFPHLSNAKLPENRQTYHVIDARVIEDSIAAISTDGQQSCYSPCCRRVNSRKACLLPHAARWWLTLEETAAQPALVRPKQHAIISELISSEWPFFMDKVAMACPCCDASQEPTAYLQVAGGGADLQMTD